MTRPNPSFRVAIISNTLSSSFVFRESLIRKLANGSQLAAVVSTNDDSENISKDFRDIPVLLLDHSHSRIQASPRPILTLAKLLKDKGTTHYHGFTHIGNSLAIILAVLNQGIPILTVTGMGRAFSNSKSSLNPARIALLLIYFASQFVANHIIVQNKDDLALFKKIFFYRNHRKLILTNGSGIKFDFFDMAHGDPPFPMNDRTTIGFFSRALAEKGVDIFYKTAQSFHLNNKLRFLHVGHPGIGIYSSDRIKDTATTANVFYAQFQVDPRQWIMASKIVVIPSTYREGLSRLVIESMLAGKVIVARSTTGVRDHIHDGRNGFIYENESDLAKTLLIALESDMESIGKSAHQYALNHFNVDEIDRIYFSTYANLARRNALKS